MPDPAEIVQNLYAAGFDLQTFERFPKAVGVSRGEVMVLLESTPQGFRMLGTPGWKIGEFMGVLTTKNGARVFQYKSETVEATAERGAAVEQFRADLEKVLTGKPS